MKRAYVDTPQGQIHYQFVGNGELLLLLHQGAFSSDQFYKIMPILGAHHHCIARDMLGYGKSDLNPPSYTIEDYARADVDFLNALGIKRASIFGTHTGAAIAVEIAAAFPETVDKLLLCAVPSFAPGMRERCIESYTFSPVEIKEDGSHFVSRYWHSSMKSSSHLDSQDRHLQVIAAAMASGGAYHGEQAFFRYNEEVRLPLIKSPTLVISPSEDILHQRLEIVSSLIPRCRTKIIQEAGSAIALEKPEELAQAILDFLENPDV